LSPGLDFETKIVWKPDAPEILRRNWLHPDTAVRPLPSASARMAGSPSNDDWASVDACLKSWPKPVTRYPSSPSALIERDADLLADMARDHLVQVMFSITTLDPLLARKLEPRRLTGTPPGRHGCPAPGRRAGRACCSHR
jgi:hypothetical protein